MFQGSFGGPRPDEIVRNILQTLGQGHMARAGRRITRSEHRGYDVTPTADIVRLGLAGSQRWFLGAKTLMQLCGRADEWDRIEALPPPSAPTTFRHYHIFSRVNPQVAYVEQMLKGIGFRAVADDR